MLLICMSISGTIPLVLCLLIWLVKRKNFSYWLGRNLILLSLAGYLTPFQIIKYLFPQEILEHVHSIEHISYFLNFDNKEAISYHGISIWMSDWLLMIVLCWLFLVLGFSLYEILKYRQLTKSVKRNSQVRNRFVTGIGNVEYRISPQIHSPYTIGFLKPFIVFPEDMEDAPLSELLLKHEYSHLHRHDSLVKLFCLLTICLHCFNPVAMLTLLLYTNFSENIADEAAVSGCSHEERKAYAITLVKLSGKTRQVPVVWRNNLLGDEKSKSMKRRVEFIMNKRNKKASKIGTVAAMLASVILSSSTIWAYSPMQTVKDAYDTDAEFVSFRKTEANTATFTDYDIYFKTADGQTMPVETSDLEESRAIICIHNFESGYADKHYSNSNGGCTVKTYTARICTKCNHLEINDYISTTIYAKCPHK